MCTCVNISFTFSPCNTFSKHHSNQTASRNKIIEGAMYFTYYTTFHNHSQDQKHIATYILQMHSFHSPPAKESNTSLNQHQQTPKCPHQNNLRAPNASYFPGQHDTSRWARKDFYYKPKAKSKFANHVSLLLPNPYLTPIPVLPTLLVLHSINNTNIFSHMRPRIHSSFTLLIVDIPIIIHKAHRIRHSHPLLTLVRVS